MKIPNEFYTEIIPGVAYRMWSTSSDHTGKMTRSISNHSVLDVKRPDILGCDPQSYIWHDVPDDCPFHFLKDEYIRVCEDKKIIDKATT